MYGLGREVGKKKNKSTFCTYLISAWRRCSFSVARWTARVYSACVCAVVSREWSEGYVREEEGERTEVTVS